MISPRRKPLDPLESHKTPPEKAGLVDPAGVLAEEKLARGLARGVTRLLEDHGFVCLPEVTLKSGRRVDLLALGRKGELLVVEIKSSLADFRTDQKWPEYLDFCEQLYFAVAEGFPLEILPPEQGLILADAYGGEFLRHPEKRPLAAARRKAMTLNFARTAARRLSAQLNSSESH